MRGFRVALLGVVTAVAAAVTVAHAQTPPPTVSLKPADSRVTDPNLGGWFVFKLAPGESSRGKARITNVADIPVRIKLYMADLVFSDSGTPSIKDTEMTDVGTWGRFMESEALLDPRQTVDKEFEILVPLDAEPGDHVGVLVAESEPQGGNIKIVPRVATRIYVTVPGDVTKSFEIRSVQTQLDSAFLPSSALVTVILRNTGRIRLNPVVEVRGGKADGAEVLLSRSVERYEREMKVPWYGGFIKVPVVARAEGGLTRRVYESVFVFPWMILIALVAVAVAYLGGRRWYRARASRLTGLQADIRRLETLIAERPLGVESLPPPLSDDEQDDIDEEAALLAAYKRVVRTGSHASMPRIALALHEINSREAKKILEQSLPHASGRWLEDVQEALRSYEPATQGDAGEEPKLKPKAKPKPKPKPKAKPKPKPSAKSKTAKPKPTSRSKKGSTPPHRPPRG